MKKINLRVLATLLTAMMLVFVSCDEDDPKGDSGDATTPVLNETFEYSVDGNDVHFTTTLTGSAWILDIETQNQYNFVNGEVSVNLPKKGVYEFSCNTLLSGVVSASEVFNVEIMETDLSFLETGIWNALTGGANVTKTWVLDSQASYYHCAYDFYGDAEAGADSDAKSWGPWGGFKVDDPEIGSIVFDGVEGTATFTLDGVATTGQFNMTVADRDPDFLTLKNGNTLWEELEAGQYSYLAPLSPETAELTMAEGVRFPLNLDRVHNWNEDKESYATYPSQFLDADLRNVMIVHASDSTLVVRVKRSYEADEENKCWLLYNFIVNEFEYAKPPKYATINTTITATDLEGTWNISPAQACGWTPWYENASANPELFNAWSDRATMMTDLISWWSFGDPGVTENVDTAGYISDATAAVSLTFNSDGTCAIIDNEYDKVTGTEVSSTVNTTYTLSNGIVTFAESVKLSAIAVTFEGTEMSVALTPSNATAGSMWVGSLNTEKEEMNLIQISPAQ
ncbi:MAG: hypothetical protein PF444_08945 [Bacteroidales bacterium]|nr:hypothetical protein [Bacteroidales bacterium]